MNLRQCSIPRCPGTIVDDRGDHLVSVRAGHRWPASKEEMRRLAAPSTMGALCALRVSRLPSESKNRSCCLSSVMVPLMARSTVTYRPCDVICYHPYASRFEQ